MPNIPQWLISQWKDFKKRWLPVKEDDTIALDQVSRFYQSEFYLSLDEGLKSAFYDGPLGGLDSRIIERGDLDFLIDCYQKWQDGRNISCGIFGEKGTGLTTLLNMFTNHLKQQEQTFNLHSLEKRLCSEHDVITMVSKLLSMEQKEYRLDEFIEQVQAMPANIIIIDNLHFLVQRTLDVQTTVDALSAIILATRGHHLWILAGEQQAWRRLCYGYKFDHLFSHQQHLDNFNESQVRHLLSKRFAYGGFNTVNGIAVDKLTTEKSPLHEISRRSRGCLELGLFHCLNNLAYGTDKNSLLIVSPQDIDMASLKKLSQIELFTLAEISAHGQLSVKEHNTLFRISANESKMILEHLRVLGILDKNEKTSHSEAYALKRIIASVVIRYLISMNYLY